MRALVTGGAGFIGSHLVDLLHDRGWVVDVIDKATGPSIQQAPEPGRCDAIFHLASPVGPLGVLDWSGRLVAEVIDCADIVRGWAISHDCPLVYVSTSEVYGSGGADDERDPCVFQAPTSARKEYAVAKLAAETMLRNTSGLDVRIVRPYNVAGPRQQPEGGFVLPRFVQQALNRVPLTVYAPGSQRRAFAHVADIAEGLLAVAERGQAGRLYNLGNPAAACSIRDLADEVIAAVGDGSVRVVDPTELHGPGFREAPDKLPNIDRAVRELGWRPTRDRAQVIADTVAFWANVMVAA